LKSVCFLVYKCDYLRDKIFFYIRLKYKWVEIPEILELLDYLQRVEAEHTCL